MKHALFCMRFALVMALVCVPVLARAERVVLVDKTSAFQRLVVVEDTVRRERYLYGDDMHAIQGLMSLRRPDDLLAPYLRSSLLGLVFAPADPSAMLYIGLGTGSLPRYLSARYPQAHHDAVEIDPAVPPIAQRYFALRPVHNLTISVADGRDFIRGATKQYDFVLMDAYFSDEIPPQLATIEFLEELRRVMTPDGVVVANLPIPERTANFWEVLATYQASFPHIRVFATESPRNFILVASSVDLSLDTASMQRRIGQLRSGHRIDVNLAALVALAPPWRTVPVAAPVLRDAPPR